MWLSLAARSRLGRQIQVLLDVAAWAIGLVFVELVRYDFAVPSASVDGLVVVIAAASACQVLVGVSLKLYRRRYNYGSFEEVAGVAATVLIVTGAIVALDLTLTPRPVPLSVACAGWLPALVLMTGSRYAWRLVLERTHRPMAEDVHRAIIFGAGKAGSQLIDALLRDSASTYLPVALLDDDPAKRHLRVRGVPMVGDRHGMAAARQKYNANTVIIAVPSADAALIRELSDLADRAELDIKVLPPVRDLMDGQVGIGDIRDIEMADLLGRHQIELDVASIASYVTGKRVLVTGAGGSIGSELCRQLVQYAPAELIMLDRDESALHAVQLSISGRALLDGDDLVLADIRDVGHLRRVFELRRPEVVFHAAALKHLTLLERHPAEAVKTNVWGTLAVLEAARDVGVERFVNISTDKAADPESVLGYSKRIAERLTAHVADEASGLYLSVRFGNVLGSRGSMLTTFTAQIQAGGPLTVTDPDVTRYFMTVQEAVQLVIQAAAVGRSGEVLVLDMGEPVRIDDVARRLVDEATRRIEIVYTGLRPGEKLHELLLGEGEQDHRPNHALVSQVRVPPLPPVAALELDPWTEAKELVASLDALATSSVFDLRDAPAKRDRR